MYQIASIVVLLAMGDALGRYGTLVSQILMVPCTRFESDIC